MGGSVLLESVAGVGTTMTVRLPFDKAPAPVGSNGSAREGTPVQSLPGLVEVLPETKKRLRRQDVHILLAEGASSSRFWWEERELMRRRR